MVVGSSDDPGSVPDGSIGLLTVTVPGGGSVQVPSRYSITAIDNSVTEPVTASDGGSLFAGNTPINYYDPKSGSRTENPPGFRAA